MGWTYHYTEGLVPGVSQLVLVDLDGLSVVLVAPTTIVADGLGGLLDVEALCGCKGLAVVKGL